MAIEENVRGSGDMAQGPRKKSRRIAISNKRQITLPKEYYDYLEMDTEANIELEGNKIVITPVRETNDDFSEFILKDLIDEGYGGDELLQEFNRRKNNIRPAVEAWIKDAQENAEDVDSVSDLFDEDE
ncbi:AbrB/MazE/SpoVT family DNA-binding domain-containing protein [Salimicrobium jeotgali]|uniref:AbrB/MazE/SpoVT family DNA-binding domain-containing protein n=1 Tax=Salimicrobium jeotgali TaxID=1230341 RepID=UPI000C823347|nr:AbrB/MazE/SpoVT family DNA-binding domain-containing protein [Salimicrobium jeotgali]